MYPSVRAIRHGTKLCATERSNGSYGVVAMTPAGAVSIGILCQREDGRWSPVGSPRASTKYLQSAMRALCDTAVEQGLISYAVHPQEARNRREMERAFGTATGFVARYGRG